MKETVPIGSPLIEGDACNVLLTVQEWKSDETYGRDSASRRTGLSSDPDNPTTSTSRRSRSLTNFRDASHYESKEEGDRHRTEKGTDEKRKQEAENTGRFQDADPELPYHMDDYLTNVGDVVNLSLGSLRLSNGSGSGPRMDSWGAEPTEVCSESSTFGEKSSKKKRGQGPEDLSISSRMKLWLLSKLKGMKKSSAHLSSEKPPEQGPSRGTGHCLTVELDSIGRSNITSAAALRFSNSNITSSEGNVPDNTGRPPSSEGHDTSRGPPSKQNSGGHPRSHQLSGTSELIVGESYSGSGSGHLMSKPIYPYHRDSAECSVMASVMTPDETGSIHSNSETAGMEVLRASVLASASAPADSSRGDLRVAEEASTRQKIGILRDSKVNARPTPPTLSPLARLKILCRDLEFSTKFGEKGKHVFGISVSGESTTVSSGVKQGLPHGDPKFLRKVSIGAKPTAPCDTKRRCKERLQTEVSIVDSGLDEKASTARKKDASKDGRAISKESSFSNDMSTLCQEDLKAEFKGEQKVRTDGVSNTSNDTKTSSRETVSSSPLSKGKTTSPKQSMTHRKGASTNDGTKLDFSLEDMKIVGKAISLWGSKCSKGSMPDSKKGPISSAVAKLAQLDQHIEKISADVKQGHSKGHKKRTEEPSPSPGMPTGDSNGQLIEDAKVTTESGQTVSIGDLILPKEEASRESAAAQGLARNEKIGGIISGDNFRAFLAGVATYFGATPSIDPGPSDELYADEKASAELYADEKASAERVPDLPNAMSNTYHDCSEIEAKPSDENRPSDFEDVKRRTDASVFTESGTFLANRDSYNELAASVSEESIGVWNWLKHCTRPGVEFPSTDFTFKADLPTDKREMVDKVSSERLPPSPTESTTPVDRAPFFTPGGTTEEPRIYSPPEAEVTGKSMPSVFNNDRTVPIESTTSDFSKDMASTYSKSGAKASRESLLTFPADARLPVIAFPAFYSDARTGRSSGGSEIERRRALGGDATFPKDRASGSTALPAFFSSGGMSAYSDNAENVSPDLMPTEFNEGPANLRKRPSSSSSSVSEYPHSDPKKEAKVNAESEPDVFKSDGIQSKETTSLGSNATLRSDVSGQITGAKVSTESQMSFVRGESTRPVAFPHAQYGTTTTFFTDYANMNKKFSMERMNHLEEALIIPSSPQAERQFDTEMVKRFSVDRMPHVPRNSITSLKENPLSDRMVEASGTTDLKKSTPESSTSSDHSAPKRAPELSTENTQNVTVSGTTHLVAFPTLDADAWKHVSFEDGGTDLKGSSERKSTALESDRIESRGELTSLPGAGQNPHYNHQNFIDNIGADTTPTLSKLSVLSTNELTELPQRDDKSETDCRTESATKDSKDSKTLPQKSISSSPSAKTEEPSRNAKKVDHKEPAPKCGKCGLAHSYPQPPPPPQLDAKAEKSGSGPKPEEKGKTNEKLSCNKCGHIHSRGTGAKPIPSSDDQKSPGISKEKGKLGTSEESMTDSKEESTSSSDKQKRNPSKVEKIIVQQVSAGNRPNLPDDVTKYFQGRGWNNGARFSPKNAKVEGKILRDTKPDDSNYDSAPSQVSSTSSLQPNANIPHNDPKLTNKCPTCASGHSTPCMIVSSIARKKVEIDPEPEPPENPQNTTQKIDYEKKPIFSKESTRHLDLKSQEASVSEDSKSSAFEAGKLPSTEPTTTMSTLSQDFTHAERKIVSKVSMESKLRFPERGEMPSVAFSHVNTGAPTALTAEDPKIGDELRASPKVAETESTTAPTASLTPGPRTELFSRGPSESIPHMTEDTIKSREELMTRHESALAVSRVDQNGLRKIEAESRPNVFGVETRHSGERPSWNYGTMLSISFGDKEFVQKIGTESKPDQIEERTTDLKNESTWSYATRNIMPDDDKKFVYRVSMENKQSIPEDGRANRGKGPTSRFNSAINQKNNVESKANIPKDKKTDSQEGPISSHGMKESKTETRSKLSKDEMTHSRNKRTSSIKQRISQGIHKIVEMVGSRDKQGTHTRGATASTDGPSPNPGSGPSTSQGNKTAARESGESKPSTPRNDTKNSRGDSSSSHGTTYSKDSLGSSPGTKLAMPSWKADPPPGINVQKFNRLLGKQEAKEEVAEQKGSPRTLSNKSNMMVVQGVETTLYSSSKPEAENKSIGGTGRGSDTDKQAGFPRRRHSGSSIRSAPGSLQDFFEQPSPQHLSEELVQRPDALAPAQRGMYTLMASDIERHLKHTAVAEKPFMQKTLSDRETALSLVESSPKWQPCFTQTAQCGDDGWMDSGTQTDSTSTKESRTKKVHSSEPRRSKHKNQASPAVSMYKADHLGKSEAATCLKSISNRPRYSNIASAKAYLRKKTRSKSPPQGSLLHKLPERTEWSNPIRKSTSPSHSLSPSLNTRQHCEKTRDQQPEGYDVLARRLAWDRKWRQRLSQKRQGSPTTSHADSLGSDEMYQTCAEAEAQSSGRSNKHRASKRQAALGRPLGSRVQKERQFLPYCDTTSLTVAGNSGTNSPKPPSPSMVKEGKRTVPRAFSKKASPKAKMREMDSREITDAHISHGVPDTFVEDSSLGSEIFAEETLLNELPYDHPAPQSSREAWDNAAATAEAQDTATETSETYSKAQGGQAESQASGSLKLRRSPTEQGGASFPVHSSIERRHFGSSEQSNSLQTSAPYWLQGSPGNTYNSRLNLGYDFSEAATEPVQRTQVRSGAQMSSVERHQQRSTYDYHNKSMPRPFAPKSGESATSAFGHGSCSHDKGHVGNTFLSMQSALLTPDAAHRQLHAPYWQMTWKSSVPSSSDVRLPPGYPRMRSVESDSKESPTMVNPWWRRGVYKNEQSNCSYPCKVRRSFSGGFVIDEVPSGLGENLKPCVFERSDPSGLHWSREISASRRPHSSISVGVQLSVQNDDRSTTSTHRLSNPSDVATSTARPWSPTCGCQFAHALSRLLSEVPRASPANMNLVRHVKGACKRAKPNTVSSESCLLCSSKKSDAPGSVPKQSESHLAWSTAIKCAESRVEKTKGTENCKTAEEVMQARVSEDRNEGFLQNANGNALTSDDYDHTSSTAFIKGTPSFCTELDFVALLLPKEIESDHFDEPHDCITNDPISSSSILEQGTKVSVDRNLRDSEPIQSTPKTQTSLLHNLVGDGAISASEDRFLNESCNGNQFSMQFIPDYDRPPALSLISGGRAALEILSQFRNRSATQRTCPGAVRCRGRPRKTNKGLAVATELYRESCRPLCVHAYRLTAMTVLQRHHVDELLPLVRGKQCWNQMKKKKGAVCPKKPTRNVKTSIEELHVLIDRVLEGRTASLQRDRSCPMDAMQSRRRAKAPHPSPSPTRTGQLDRSHNFATEALLAKVEDIQCQSGCYQSASPTECFDTPLGVSYESVLGKDPKENSMSSKEVLHSLSDAVALPDSDIEAEAHSKPDEDLVKLDLPVGQDASSELKREDAEAGKKGEEPLKDFPVPKLSFVTEASMRVDEAKDPDVRVAEWVKDINRRIEEIDRVSEWSMFTASNASSGRCLSSVDVRPSLREVQQSSRNSPYIVPRYCSLGLNVLASSSSPDIAVKAARSDYTIFSRSMNLYLSSLQMGSGERHMSFYCEKKNWAREANQLQRQYQSESRVDELSSKSETGNGSKLNHTRKEVGGTLRENRAQWMSSMSLLEDPIAEDDVSTCPTVCNNAKEITADQMISTKEKSRTTSGPRPSPKQRHRHAQAKGLHSATPEKQTVLASMKNRIRNLTCCVPAKVDDDATSDSANSEYGFRTEPFIIYDARQKAETVLRLIATSRNMSASNCNAGRRVPGQESRRGRRVLRRSSSSLTWTPHYTASQTSSNLAEGNFPIIAPSTSMSSLLLMQASHNLVQPEAPVVHSNPINPKRRSREGERRQKQRSAWDELFRILSLAAMLFLAVDTDGACHPICCAPTVTTDVMLRGIRDAVNSGAGSH